MMSSDHANNKIGVFIRVIKRKPKIECMNSLFVRLRGMYSLQTFVYEIKKNTLPIFIFTIKHVCQSITSEYELCR